MGFVNLFFWIAFSGYFLLYWTILNRPGRLRLRNISLLLVSYLFYASWDWRFLGIIVFSSILDYIIGIKLDTSKNIKKRKWLLFLSVFINLGFLSIFKYHNFFIESTQLALNSIGVNHDLLYLNWVLPVGISFYTFQTMSYTIDVYRKEITSTKDPFVFFTYIAFFPQLLAGPIERAKDLIPQFEKTHSFDLQEAKKAVLRILWGAFKKIVIANRLAFYVNEGYANPEQLTGLTTVLVIVFFVIQLYCDFSGYCDMAIGSARLLGFKLSENFTRPLLAKNIKTVYQRWHITIHEWFRDYVYFQLKLPKTTSRKVLNVLIVFGLAGLWHGSGWNFLLWGILNGILIILFDPVIDKASETGNLLLISTTRILGHTAVYLSLIFFRSKNLDQAKAIFSGLSRWEFSMGNIKDFTNQIQLGLNKNEIFFGLLFIFIIFSVEYYQEYHKDRVNSFYQGNGLNRWFVTLALSLNIIFFGFYNGRIGGKVSKDTNDKQEQFIYVEF
ncbi:MBOAT family protein [Bacteroidia bacterium]|nr:MBOAT family protein [Bacteroidia bacterium]